LLLSNLESLVIKNLSLLNIILMEMVTRSWIRRRTLRRNRGYGFIIELNLLVAFFGSVTVAVMMVAVLVTLGGFVVVIGRG
jgi:hypothetical protein